MSVSQVPPPSPEDLVHYAQELEKLCNAGDEKPGNVLICEAVPDSPHPFEQKDDSVIGKIRRFFYALFNTNRNVKRYDLEWNVIQIHDGFINLTSESIKHDDLRVLQVFAKRMEFFAQKANRNDLHFEVPETHTEEVQAELQRALKAHSDQDPASAIATALEENEEALSTSTEEEAEESVEEFTEECIRELADTLGVKADEKVMDEAIEHLEKTTTKEPISDFALRTFRFFTHPAILTPMLTEIVTMLYDQNATITKVGVAVAAPVVSLFYAELFAVSCPPALRSLIKPVISLALCREMNRYAQCVASMPERTYFPLPNITLPDVSREPIGFTAVTLPFGEPQSFRSVPQEAEPEVLRDMSQVPPLMPKDWFSATTPAVLSNVTAQAPMPPVAASQPWPSWVATADRVVSGVVDFFNPLNW